MTEQHFEVMCLLLDRCHHGMGMPVDHMPYTIDHPGPCWVRHCDLLGTDVHYGWVKNGGPNLDHHFMWTKNWSVRVMMAPHNRPQEKRDPSIYTFSGCEKAFAADMFKAKMRFG